MVSRETDRGLAARCKEVREVYLGISSKRELARRMELAGEAITGVSIGRYEGETDDSRDATASYLQALVALAGVNGHWLLTGEGEPLVMPESEAQRRMTAVRKALDRDLTALVDDAGDSVL